MINMIDIVIPILDELDWLPLKYTLRSVCKNVRNYGCIFLLTKHDIPQLYHGLDDLKIINIPDKWQVDRDANQINKIITACKLFTPDIEVSDDFLLMNDDFFIFKTIVLPMEQYVLGTLQERLDAHDYSNLYYAKISNLKKILESMNSTTYDFDGHFPMMINKKKFIEIMAKIDWTTEPLMFRSFYGNLADFPSMIQTVDLKFNADKISTQQLFPQVSPKILGLPRFHDRDPFCFSINELIINGNIHKFLRDMFPEKSKYER